mmetsp:Transcript_13937/g.23704  ORF Transcript_13937/g.23704 Transcript_13937/m.23704 type:complete len:92 (-) Transcript_13937:1938-2213(-)
MKTSADLKNQNEGETLFDLMKALDEGHKKFESVMANIEDDDVINLCILVNEDVLSTKERFRDLKLNKRPKPFIPAESKTPVKFLEPSYVYG